MAEGEPPPPSSSQSSPDDGDDMYDVAPPALPPVPPPHSAPRRPVPVQPLPYGKASYEAPGDLRGYPVLGQQLAKASWAAPCIAFGLNCCAGGAARHSGGVVIGVVNLGLILFGFGAGIVCLTQLRRWGRSGVLAPAIVGVCLNGLLILAMVSVIVMAIAAVTEAARTPADAAPPTAARIAAYTPGMIHDARVRPLNDAEPAHAAKYVLYWMQASQRGEFNHALEYAAERANGLGLPLLVGFGLMDDYPEANERHYVFMLEGLRDVEAALAKRGVRFVVRHGSPERVALKLAQDAAVVVCDRGYTRHQKQWRDVVADGARCEVVQVESDVVVPVETASVKQEYAARTIRPRVMRHVEEFLKPVTPVKLKRDSLGLKVEGDIDVSDPAAAVARLKVDRSVKASPVFTGGGVAAHKRLAGFIRSKLAGYDDGRNEPAAAHTSTMSGYLHFGQISPVEIALRVRAHDAAPKADRDAFVEELIVRRELAVNFVHYCPKYDEYEALPEWARKTLSEHRNDERYHVYTRAQLERAETHDEYWNAAQREMLLTGFMHNYMRMYWGKKVLEWGRTPQQAYADLLYLNNKHFLCGRDPNGWANCAWIFGLHDRPWGPPRKIFGTVRYMNAAGLDRKFDMPAYVANVEALRKKYG